MAAAVTTLDDFAEIKCRITTARTLSGFTEYALDCTRYNKQVVLLYSTYVNCSDFLRGRFLIFFAEMMQGTRRKDKSKLRLLKSTVSHGNL
jgi:hypothetical protein